MTELNRENPSHNILDDLVARNQNWDKVESHLDKTASDSELGHVMVDGVTITETDGVISLAPTPVREITDASHTIQTANINEWLIMNRADAQTLTFPKDTLPVGAKGGGVQAGAGQVTLAAAADVTLLSYDSEVRTTGAGAVFGWIVEATNTIRVFGNLEAVS